jgi:hypothetical protein
MFALQDRRDSDNNKRSRLMAPQQAMLGIVRKSSLRRNDRAARISRSMQKDWKSEVLLQLIWWPLAPMHPVGSQRYA